MTGCDGKLQWPIAGVWYANQGGQWHQSQEAVAGLLVSDCSELGSWQDPGNNWLYEKPGMVL